MNWKYVFEKKKKILRKKKPRFFMQDACKIPFSDPHITTNAI